MILNYPVFLPASISNPVYRSETTFRVRYAETDRMGFVYYGHYAVYLEVARVEMLRKLGIAYKDLEDRGILLPVLEYTIKYHKPAFYDDMLTVRTTLPALPSARIVFGYEVVNQAGDVLAVAGTTLVFVDRNTLKPCPAPADVLDRIRPHFTESGSQLRN